GRRLRALPERAEPLHGAALRPAHTGALARRRPRKQDRRLRRRPTHALSTKVRQAEKRLERLEDPGKPWTPWELRLEFRAGKRGGERVLELQGAVAERGAFRLGPLDLDVRIHDRVAIVGPNGSGKSTLVEALLGTLPLAAGTRTLGSGVE